jgi:bifunctional DNase/RNase
VEKIRLEIIGLSSSQSHTGSFALILGEVDGNRRLPIIIGMFEAQAIAIEIEKVTPQRPMTHDLFKSFANAFHFQVNEILISDLREGVFYAKLICSDGIHVTEIDTRPSDAIAIGLRFDVPIFTYEPVMSEAGILMNEDEDETDAEDESNEESEDSHLDGSSWDETTDEDSKESATPSNIEFKSGSYGSYSKEQLTKMLNDAINNEEYEKAAQIRDILNNQ